jgi:hypothetical protein
MKNSNYSFPKLLAIGFIIVCTGIAWALLGVALVHRTDQAAFTLSTAVQNGWGGPLAQAHPWAWYESPTGKDGKKGLTRKAPKLPSVFYLIRNRKGYSGFEPMMSPSRVLTKLLTRHQSS